MPHGDDHALWIDPNDPRVMILGNDGGATVSVTGGQSWSSQLNQPTGEMYRVDGRQSGALSRLRVAAGSIRRACRCRAAPPISVSVSSCSTGTPSADTKARLVAVDPRDPNVVFATGRAGRLTRYDRAVPRLRMLNVTAGGRAAYRFAGTSPIVVSPLDPENALQHVATSSIESSDGGQTSTVISPDLTGGATEPAARRGDGTPDEAASVADDVGVRRVAQGKRRPLGRHRRRAGADIARRRREVDERHAEGHAGFGLVNTIEPSPHDAPRVSRAYRLPHRRLPAVSLSDRRLRPDVDAAHERQRHSGQPLPSRRPRRSRRKGLLYAGGEFGMYVSFDDGRRWQSLQLNLPVTPVTDIVVSQGDLVLSTNGQSFWILDDVTPLREMAASAVVNHAPLSAARHLSPADLGRRERRRLCIRRPAACRTPRDLYTGARIERHQLGEEPPDGAIIYAWLPQVPTEGVTLAVVGSGNAPIRTIFDTAKGGESPRLVAGLNRFSWNLRYDDARGGRTTLLGERCRPAPTRSS